MPVNAKSQIRHDQYGDPLPEKGYRSAGTGLRHVIRLSGVDPLPSPDGKTLATLGDEGIRLWNMESGQLLWQSNHFHFLKFVPDGKLLAAEGVSDPELPPKQQRQAVCFLDTATGRVCPTDCRHTAKSLPSRPMASTRLSTAAAAIKPLAYGRSKRGGSSSKRRSIRRSCAWRRSPAIVERFLPSITPRRSVIIGILKRENYSERWRRRLRRRGLFAFLPMAELWPWFPTAERLSACTIRTPASCVASFKVIQVAANYGIDFSADSRILATEWATSWDEKATISLWDANTGKPLRRFQVYADIAQSLRLAPDGQTVLTTGGDAARFICGTASAVGRVCRCGPLIATRSKPWRSRRMAGNSSPAMIGRCGCGRRIQASTSVSCVGKCWASTTWPSLPMAAACSQADTWRRGCINCQRAKNASVSPWMNSRRNCPNS